MSKGFTDRIVAGKWKGKGLVLPDDVAVRPSKNRVRQGVFNMLGSRLEWQGLRVADLCCGSGAWGLEAASRGAGEVVLADMNVAVARKNAAAVGADVARITQADVRVWVPEEKFDVVLADPPYGSGIVQDLLRRAGVFSNPGAWWCVEYGTGEEVAWPLEFGEVQVRAHGASTVAVGKFSNQ